MAMNRKKNYSPAAERVSRAEETRERIRRAAALPAEEVFGVLGTRKSGLTGDEAAARLARYGENSLPQGKKQTLFSRLCTAFINPFTVVLCALALVSALTDIVFAPSGKKDFVTVSVISAMIVVSGAVRFVQEFKSDAAAEKLRAMLTVSADVVRGGKREEIPVREIAVGDVVCLSAGDMVPADLRLVFAKDLFVAQSALTGESAPEEKTAEVSPAEPEESACLVWQGTNVVSGSGTGLVIAAGADTRFAGTAELLGGRRGKTAFERGVNSVSHVLIGFMLVMVPLVFLLNGLTKGNWPDALLFAVSIAVGLTPEMLPMIVAAGLAKGASSLAKKKTIVRDLDAVQNLGGMDILCTDKTGTLTRDKVALELYLDAAGKEDGEVLRLAFFNSACQTGLKSPLDAAVIEKVNELRARGEIFGDRPEEYRKTDEIPFDFERRRMSVAVSRGEGTLLVTKGAVEEMLAVSSYAKTGEGIRPLTGERKAAVRARADELNRRGLRVLAVAEKRLPEGAGVSCADESEMVFVGYLAFLDPPKPTAKRAVRRLQALGVSVKILTGDNEKVTACVCRKVGIPTEKILLGGQIDGMDDAQLAREAESTSVFAKLSPAQKERVVRALRAAGHVVGFLGDGINDAPAMRAADAGISVDTAADIARESAGILLLEKDLTVVADGVLEGRRTYVNTMKYIKITVSSNFGNMLSVLAASVFLPFLPILPVQLLLLNLVYDLSCTSLPWDNAEENLSRPVIWESRSIVKFMLWFGPVSSLFDIATYLLLYYVVCPASEGVYYAAADEPARQRFEALFRSGWFVESIFTQSLVLHMLRSEKFPFLRTRASLPVCVFTFGGIALLTALPFTAAGKAVGLCPLTAACGAAIALAVAGYVALTSIVKRGYIRRYGKWI